MKNYVSSAACACVLGLTAACTPAVPPDTRQASVQAVKDIEAAWAKDSALKDPGKFASYYSAGAVCLFPNSPPVTGQDNIKAAIAGMMADPNFALSFQGTQAEAAKGGELVYTVGTYSLTMSDPKDKKPVTDKGKYMTVYKKQADGTWKAVAGAINSDLPPGAPH
jgi:ketosteroid isomerase-like protein